MGLGTRHTFAATLAMVLIFTLAMSGNADPVPVSGIGAALVAYLTKGYIEGKKAVKATP